MPQFPQIDRQKGFEEHQGSAAVADGVKDFDGNALFIIVKPHQPPVVLPKPHRLAGVGDILFQKGAGGVVGLAVVPKGPLFNTHGKGGKAGHGLVHRPLKGSRVHPLGHKGGKAVNGGVCLFLNGGIEHPRVVQGVPFGFLLFFLGHGRRSLPAFVFL